jgi:hypothetical protein
MVYEHVDRTYLIDLGSFPGLASDLPSLFLEMESPKPIDLLILRSAPPPPPPTDFYALKNLVHEETESKNAEGEIGVKYVVDAFHAGVRFNSLR